MRILAFCGPSNSGKTWMIERLVARWSERGLRVGVLKHCSKGYQIDREGKDSARCWGSGAAVVGVVGPQEWTVRRQEVFADPMQVIEAAFPEELDVVLLEGFREVAVPRIRVFGDDETPTDAELVPGTIACVARHPVAIAGAEMFALDDDEGLSRFLVRRFALAAGRPANRPALQA